MEIFELRNTSKLYSFDKKSNYNLHREINKYIGFDSGC